MLTRSKKLKLEEAEKHPVKVPIYFNPQRIPIEVWNQIFKHNSTKDLLNLSLVCKTFYETIGDLPAAMDKINLKLSPGIPPEVIMKSTRNYSNLILRLLHLNHINLFSKFIKKIGSNWKTLELICCRILENDFIDILELVHTNLRSLKVHEVHLKQDGSCILTTFKFNQLQEIEISSCHSVVFGVLFDLLPPHISEIVFPMAVTNRTMKKIANKFPELKKLVLVKGYDNVFKSVSLNSLEILYIIESMNTESRWNDNNLKKSASAIKNNLRVLKIGEAVPVCSGFLRWVLKHLKNLRHLEIHNDSVLDILFLCENSQLFKDLKFFAVKAESDEFENLARCLTKFPELKSVFDKNLEMDHYSQFIFNWDQNYDDASDQEDEDNTNEDEEDFFDDSDNSDEFGEERDSDDSSSVHDDSDSD